MKSILLSFERSDKAESSVRMIGMLTISLIKASLEDP